MNKWAVIEIDKSTGNENQLGLFEKEKDAIEFSKWRNDYVSDNNYKTIIRCGVY